MSRTTSATQLAPNSPMRRSGSCVKKFPRIGRTSAIRSPTISASSTPRIFGLWRERGIVQQPDFFRTLRRPLGIRRVLRKAEGIDQEKTILLLLGLHCRLYARKLVALAGCHAVIHKRTLHYLSWGYHIPARC